MALKQKTTIEISLATILKAFAVIALVAFAYLIKEVLAMLFFALIVASAVNVPVRWLKHHRIPRTIGVIAIYAVSIIAFGLILALVITPLASELKQFSEFVPKITSSLSSGFSFVQRATEGQEQIQQFFVNLSEKLSQFKINFFGLTGNIVGRIASFVFVFILSFYLAIEEEGVRKFIKSITPKSKERYAIKAWERGQAKLSRWLGSQLLLGFIVGLMTFVGLSLIRVPYAFGLSLLAAILEIVPTVGPILAAIPAILIAFIKSPLLGIVTLLLYIVVQQLESNLLTPKIMQKTIGLNPVVTILVLLIGVKLGGFAGMVLAIPITMLISEFSSDILGFSIFQRIKPK